MKRASCGARPAKAGGNALSRRRGKAGAKQSALAPASITRYRLPRYEREAREPQQRARPCKHDIRAMMPGCTEIQAVRSGSIAYNACANRVGAYRRRKRQSRKWSRYLAGSSTRSTVETVQMPAYWIGSSTRISVAEI